MGDNWFPTICFLHLVELPLCSRYCHIEESSRRYAFCPPHSGFSSTIQILLTSLPKHMNTIEKQKLHRITWPYVYLFSNNLSLEGNWPRLHNQTPGRDKYPCQFAHRCDELKSYFTVLFNNLDKTTDSSTDSVSMVKILTL